VRLTTSRLSRAECREIWEPKPPGTLWATPDLLRDSFTFTLLPLFYFGVICHKVPLASTSRGRHLATLTFSFTHVSSHFQ
jgi:hypothetical protein